MRKKKTDIVLQDYEIIGSKISKEKLRYATEQIAKIVSAFCADRPITLVALDSFLVSKYKAKKVDWKDIDKCTRTKVRRYNKYCQTVFCVSECRISEEDYYASYIINRANCINPSQNKDDFFYDMFLIVSSEDHLHLSNYYIGGQSEGFVDEMYVLAGKHLCERLFRNK